MKLYRIKLESKVEAIRIRNDLGDYLKENGYAPGHWYANWKKIKENIWILITSEERGLPTNELIVEILFRECAPNEGCGATYVEPPFEQVKTLSDNYIKPELLELLHGFTKKRKHKMYNISFKLEDYKNVSS